MKGIILAAGRGRRMGAATDDLPKCRTVLKGKELIQWQLDALGGASINDIAIVRGYLAETFNFDLKYFDNTRWSETNMVMSLVAAEDWLKTDTCIASYSDIVYSTDAVNRLEEYPGDIVITYDPNWEKLWTLRFDDPLSDAETFRLDGDRVIEIGGRASAVEEIEGQYMGLIKFTPDGWAKVKKYLKTFLQDQLHKMDNTKLLQGLINADVTIKAVAIQDEWFEVDTERDLNAYSA